MSLSFIAYMAALTLTSLGGVYLGHSEALWVWALLPLLGWKEEHTTDVCPKCGHSVECKKCNCKAETP